MIDDEIRDALKIDPSPEFLARVRTRIANEPEPSGWRWSWTLAAAGAIAASIVLAMVMSRTAPQVVPAPVPDVVQAFRPAETAPDPRPSASVVSGFSRTAPHKTIARPEPEILIDPRERRALLQLIAGVRDGRIDLSAAQRSVTPLPTELDPVTDIVIAPLTIDPLAPVSGAEGVRP